MATTDTFDYIVIGAGSAGAAAAVRLAQGGSHSVLLLEAGPASGHPWTKIPMAVGKMLGKGIYTRHFFTEPDPQLKDRKIYWPRGWVVGGSSTINGLMWVHGTPAAYNRWAADGCPGWGWEDLKPWFRRIENYDKGDASFRGHDGPVQVSEFKPVDDGPDAWLDSLEASGVGKRVADYNKDGIGGGYLQFNTRRGRRSGTNEAYVEPNRHLSNLSILTETMASRVVLEGKRAVGLIARKNGAELRFNARKEIILSGGSFNSPQLLELSGIGRRDVLAAQGISCVHELPMVGENLSEHVHSPLCYTTKPGISWNRRLISKYGQMSDGLRWALFGTGRLASLSMTVQAFVSKDNNSTEADMKLQLSQISLPGNREKKRALLDAFDGITLASFQITPFSRGSSHIQSADPAGNPRMISNHLTDQRDLDACLGALKRSRRIASSGRLSSWITGEIRPGPDAGSDEALIEHLRLTGATAYHPVGTCRMGADAVSSVVSPELKVHGIEGLRVADCSIMPNIASTNTNAIAIVIGERAADFALKAASKI